MLILLETYIVYVEDDVASMLLCATEGGHLVGPDILAQHIIGGHIACGQADLQHGQPPSGQYLTLTLLYSA